MIVGQFRGKQSGQIETISVNRTSAVNAAVCAGDIWPPVEIAPMHQETSVVAWIIPKDALSSCFSTQGIT